METFAAFMVVALLSYAFLHVSLLLGISLRRRLFKGEAAEVDNTFDRYRTGRVFARRATYRAFLRGCRFSATLYQVRVRGTGIGLLVYEDIPFPVLIRRRAMLIPWGSLDEAQPTTLPWTVNPARHDAVQLGIAGTPTSLVTLRDTWRHLASLGRGPLESEKTPVKTGGEGTLLGPEKAPVKTRGE